MLNDRRVPPTSSRLFGRYLKLVFMEEQINIAIAGGHHHLTFVVAIEISRFMKIIYDNLQ